MSPASPATTPSTSFLAFPASADAPAWSQCSLFRDDPREIRLAVATSLSAPPPDHPFPASPASSVIAAPCAGAEVRLSVDGGRAARCSYVLVNGRRRTLQDRWFAILLRFVAAHLRSAGSWSSRAALGMGGTRNAPTYIRRAFAGLLPAGFHVIEGDRLGNFRLNPALVVELIAWDVLAQHPNSSVQAAVAEQRRRDVGA